MRDDIFRDKYHVRCADRCCANCKYGSAEFEGEATCDHPEREQPTSHNSDLFHVCDVWKPREDKKNE